MAISIHDSCMLVYFWAWLSHTLCTLSEHVQLVEYNMAPGTSIATECTEVLLEYLNTE